MNALNTEIAAEAVVAPVDLNFEEIVEKSDEMDLAALDDALGTIEDTAVEDDVDAKSEPLSEDFLQELDMVAARAESYENQEAASMPDIADTKANAGKKITTKPAKTPKVAGAAKTPAAPRVARELAALPVDLFVLDKTASFTTVGDFEANKAAVIAKRPGQVKIAEKFDNLFVQINAGKLPSVYVMKAFDALSVTGSLSSAELIAHYKASGLGDGTARSQCGQIMVLFDAVGIATRTGHSLALNADSKIAEAIRSIKAPAPATV